MNYRTTHIYRRSLELIDFVAEVLRSIPPGFGFLADQLRRNSSSVPLNYLEGCGRTGVADRRRFFVGASASAHEAAGTLDVMRCFGILDEARCRKGQDLCDHLIAMLRRFR
jgi:four helix bundle protein